MKVFDKIAAAGIVPVVVLDRAEDAVSTARALLDGGIDVMEITFRTAAAGEAIKTVSEECPEMLVGAGTVINLQQCKTAVGNGARFVVAPGFDEETVAWCVENGIPVIPGCVTPTEIMRAQHYGLNILKFFPANIYGGLKAIKALSGPFPGLKFIPTGGIGPDNLAEYASSPAVYALGGSWICPKKDILAGEFGHITEMCKKARSTMMGFELSHVGINCDNGDICKDVCGMFEDAFGFALKNGKSSNFVSDGIEVMKTAYKGEKGHIAIGTNSIPVAAAELEKRGWLLDMDSAKYKGERLSAVYLKNEIYGFAIHLLQK